MRRMWLIAVLVAGCHFGVKGVDGGDNGAIADDLGVGDDGGADESSDLAGAGFVPSHVDPGTYLPGAADLPHGITAIDTTALTLNGQAPPAGVQFVPAPGHD
jgi:hypothetical protein